MLQRLSIVAPFLLSSSLAVVPPAQAQSGQLNRCTDASGAAVYTDRSCQALGATPRAAPAANTQGNTGELGPRGGCARRLSELTTQIRSAVSAGDVNRLSSIYLWSPMNDTAANRVLGQLESIVRRPLVDILPVYPDPASSQLDDAALATLTPPPETPQAAPLPAGRPRPVGLRLEQTLANSSTPARTVLQLRRQYNCFWVTL